MGDAEVVNMSDSIQNLSTNTPHLLFLFRPTSIGSLQVLLCRQVACKLHYYSNPACALVDLIKPDYVWVMAYCFHDFEFVSGKL